MLIDKDNPLLRQRSCLTPNDLEFRQKIAGILDRFVLQYNGLGLAAPQLGISYQAFVINNKGKRKVIFNPVLLDISEDIILGEESCLSIPGISVKIYRPRVINVEIEDIKGKKEKVQYSGLGARIFMHERDHLFALLITDYIGVNYVD